MPDVKKTWEDRQRQAEREATCMRAAIDAFYLTHKLSSSATPSCPSYMYPSMATRR